MKSIYALVAGLLLALTATQASAANIAGVNMPDQIQYAGKTMVLNGAGVRKKFLMTIYVGGLYLTTKSNDGDAIIQADEPMSIRLAITSSMITPDKMKSTTLQGFRRAMNGNISPLKKEIDQLMSSFDKGVSRGDVYELTNVPGSGVHIIRNGKRVETIRSKAFKATLFGIWLSKTPVNAGLRARMLGM
ncbi:MAG: chalcone isomerase [Proteobacteria bacterium]|nr:MAG: chalcone isomerase [Pseudomonadota bacterium]